MNARRFSNIAIVLAVALLASSCAATDMVSGWFQGTTKSKLRGERISVMSIDETLRIDDTLRSVPVQLPPPYKNTEWPEPGGYASNAMYHLEAPGPLQQVWAQDAGKSSDTASRLTAAPVVGGGRIFVLDSAAHVFAFDAGSGNPLWDKSLAPSGTDESYLFGLFGNDGTIDPSKGFGGGVAYDDGKLFATSGFGEVIAFDARTGKQLWKQSLGVPIVNAPSANGGRVFVSTQENHLYALAQADGRRLWDHQGISEIGGLLESTSAAISGEFVMAPYSSGEIYALRVQNGRPAWNDMLTHSGVATALSELDDIAGRPVVDRDVVYVISHSGIMAAIGLNNGERLWSRDIGGIQTPWAAGDYVYVLTTDEQLICLTRKEGKVKWIHQLQRWDNPDNKSGAIVWAGPVLVSDRLVVVSSKGIAAAVSPYTGELIGKMEIPSGTYIAPVVANGMMYLYTSDAQLVALRFDAAMPFVLAIVGRPNVGKSTLFNKLVGRKIALVHDTPGVTRDRFEADAALGNLAFRVIDTAGFENDTPDSLAGRMTAQTLTAIADADACLFVIDARAGVTAGDQIIAQSLHRAGKTVILAANKCESRAGDAGVGEAYSLGFGEPIAISAEHRIGFPELEHALSAFIEPSILPPIEEDEDAGEDAPEEFSEDDVPDEPREDRPIRLAIVGRPNVGKSSLFNRLLGEERTLTGPEAGITRDAIAAPWSAAGREFLLHDTAGLRRKARTAGHTLEEMSVGGTLEAIRYADCVLVVIDATQAFEKQDLTIADMIAREGRAVVFVANKWDLIQNRAGAVGDLRDRLDKSLPQVIGAPLVGISALTGEGIDRIVAAIVTADTAWNKRVGTHALNRFLENALERHAPPAVSGRRVRIRYMTQVKARPPTFALFGNQLDSLPEDYVRYLTNGLRKSFDLIGTPLRFLMRTQKNPYAKK